MFLGDSLVEEPEAQEFAERPGSRVEAVRKLYVSGRPWHGRDQDHREEHESYDEGGKWYLGRMDEEEQDGRQECWEDGWIAGTMAT